MKTLRKKEVAEKLHVSTQCIDKWVREEAFVRPFYIGTQVPLWDEADIDAWLESKKQGATDGTSISKAESVSVA